MNQTMLIQEHEAGFHEDQRIRKSRIGRCPMCSPEILTAEGSEIAKKRDLEDELRATKLELEQLRAAQREGATGPLVWAVSGGRMKSLGESITAIMERLRADGRDWTTPPDPPTESEFDGGSLCTTCVGYRWRPSGAAFGDPEFGKLHLCLDCPEGRALNERKAALPSGVPKKFANCRFDDFLVTPESRFGFECVNAWMQAVIDGTAARPFFYVYGDYGAGKTTLSAACVNAWEEATASRGMWVTSDQLFDRIRATYGKSSDESTEEVSDLLKTVRFLAIDDLGTSKVTEWLVEKLFDLINTRHNEGRATIFTSNLDLDQLAERLNAGTPPHLPQPGDRIMWRIIESAVCQELMGPNLHDPDIRGRLGLDEDDGRLLQEAI